jgi:hypothetical protein
MTQEERSQRKLRKKQLDEKYLQKQLIRLSENKPEILIRLKSFKRKHKSKNSKDIFLLQHQIVRLLNTNNRTIDLLVKEKLIKNTIAFISPIYTLSDITSFIHLTKIPDIIL